MADQSIPVGAVVLAAGQAKRMGRSKLDLPWPQGGTVLGRVLDVLLDGGVDDCVVVIGGHRRRIEKIATERRVRLVVNPDYQTEEMLTSIHVGLTALESGPAQGALIMPADHPLVHEQTISGIVVHWRTQPDRIWVPSYKRRRGHPILVPRAWWPALLSEKGERGLRSFLDRHAENLEYFNVDDPGIRIDIDDQANYLELRDRLSS